jgi:hypothetical protein
MVTPLDISGFTPEQKAAFQSAAQLGSGVSIQNNGSQYDIGGTNTTTIATPPTISSATLNPPATTNFGSPQPYNNYPVAGLNAELTLTEPEQQAQGGFDVITALEKQLIGESDYRAEQEKTQGITDLTKTQSDLSARLKGLQNEALAIPLQLQQDATGRGITEGGLRPHQTAALRNNAIQALSTASLLEASRGNLTTALDLVDRAVAQKFDPIKEQIAVAKENLDLILKSPAYSLADKNRAQRAKDIQDARSRQINQQEADAKLLQGWQVDAIKNGAPIELIRQTEGKTPQQVLQLLGQYLTDPIAKQKSLLDLENQRLINEKLKIDISLMGTIPGITGVSPYQAERQTRITQEVDNLLGRVNGAVVGFGSLTTFIPTSPARDFKADLDSLKANIAFGELTAMREASKTGGALGNVSDRELALLTSALAGLDQGQSVESFKENLNQIKASLQRWNDAVKGMSGINSPLPTTITIAPNGDEIIIID